MRNSRRYTDFESRFLPSELRVVLFVFIAVDLEIETFLSILNSFYLLIRGKLPTNLCGNVFLCWTYANILLICMNAMINQVRVPRNRVTEKENDCNYDKTTVIYQC